MLSGLLRKPIFWIGLIIIFIIVLIVLLFETKSTVVTSDNQQATRDKSPQSISQKQKLKPGTCLILEQKYCDLGKASEWKNPAGQVFKIVSFNLPEGVSIMAPFDGTFTYSDGPGNLIDPNAPAAVVYKPVTKTDQTNLTFMVTGDIEFDKEQTIIKKGDQIARAGNTGFKVLGGTVAALVTKIENSKTINDENLFNIILNKK
ncbi:MAG: hypothetical protein HYT08_04505 [Candidatus Levybacteria bacterium]|nr:hypothetical protein [Candidatus Levybacteria bacterium]